MNSKISIINYSPDLEQQHFEFATKMFGKRRKRRNPDYIYWKFKGESDQELKSFKLAVSNDKVIGQLGLIPCRLRLDNEIVNTQWACDLMVDKEFRGKGVAKLLYQAAHDQKEITLGSDPSPSAKISMIRSGYKKLSSSNKQFIPIYLGVPLKMKGIKIKSLDRVQNPFLNIYRQKKNDRKFEEVDIFKMDHDLIFHRINSNQVAIQIDHHFKKWRFNAFKDYYPGVKLYNLRETETYFSGYYHGNMYFITDIYLSNKDDFSAIINFILKLIPKKIERIRFLNNIDENILGSRLTTIKYRTVTSIIYYTENKMIEDKMKDKYFYYTHQDSDENV